MKPIQDFLRRTADEHDPSRTCRFKQAGKFEILAAVSQAEAICPIWITDRLSKQERVSL
jgi:hypothetical protein